jgi:hypothetical protein
VSSPEGTRPAVAGPVLEIDDNDNRRLGRVPLLTLPKGPGLSGGVARRPLTRAEGEACQATTSAERTRQRRHRKQRDADEDETEAEAEAEKDEDEKEEGLRTSS